MEDKKLTRYEAPQEVAEQPLPEYVPPKVITYTDAEILEEMGPAQAVTDIIDP